MNRERLLLSLSIVISVVIHTVAVFFLLTGANEALVSCEKTPVQFSFCRGELVRSPVKVCSPLKVEKIQFGPLRERKAPGIFLQDTPAVPVAPGEYTDEPFLSMIKTIEEPNPERETIKPLCEILKSR